MQLVYVPLCSYTTFLTAVERVHTHTERRQLLGEISGTARETGLKCSITRIFSTENSPTRHPSILYKGKVIVKVYPSFERISLG